MPQCRVQGDGDAVALLRAAVDKLDQTKHPRTRFTYLELNHTQNFNEKGKSKSNESHLYEVTYIADLPYFRLLEENGKALKGRALEAEQRRYDNAVRDRASLDDRARAKLLHTMVKSAGVNLSLLKTQFRVTSLGHATQDERDCLLLDAVRLQDGPKKHYRVWLEPVTQEIVRVDFEQLGDEGDLLQGGTGTQTWTHIDGTPLTTTVHIDARVPTGNKHWVRVVSDHTYSHFRRFTATSKMVEIEPEDKAAPPQ